MIFFPIIVVIVLKVNVSSGGVLTLVQNGTIGSPKTNDLQFELVGRRPREWPLVKASRGYCAASFRLQSRGAPKFQHDKVFRTSCLARFWVLKTVRFSFGIVPTGLRKYPLHLTAAAL